MSGVEGILKGGAEKLKAVLEGGGPAKTEEKTATDKGTAGKKKKVRTS